MSDFRRLYRVPTSEPATVMYHGYGDAAAAAGRLVTVTRDGSKAPLRHIVRHSPTGLTWGYGGSRPAGLARSLLVDALGPAADCSTCRGVRAVLCSTPVSTPEWGVPRTGGAVLERCPDCDDGVSRALPYQDFKFAVVAQLGDSLTLTRDQILNWLTERSARQTR